MNKILEKIIKEIEKEGHDYADGDGYKIGLNSAIEIIRNFETNSEIFTTKCIVCDDDIADEGYCCMGCQWEDGKINYEKYKKEVAK